MPERLTFSFSETKGGKLHILVCEHHLCPYATTAQFINLKSVSKGHVVYVGHVVHEGHVAYERHVAHEGHVVRGSRGSGGSRGS